MLVLSAMSLVRTVVLTSGVGRSDHHLTHVMLAYSTGTSLLLLGCAGSTRETWHVTYDTSTQHVTH